MLDLLSIAQSLVQCDSDTSRTNRACSDLLREMLRQRGFEVLWHDYRDIRGCPKVAVSARRLGASSSGRGIAFFSHSDVVSSDGWKTPFDSGPTDGLVRDGKLWGRGACDMKGPIASALAAVDGVLPTEQTAPIYFFITGDEECGMLGAELLVKHCPFYREVASSDVAGVITEPTNQRVVSRHKGGCRFRVTARGIAAHSSTADGQNANWPLIPFLNYLAAMRQQIDSDPGLMNQDFRPPTLSLNVVLHNTPAEFNITPSRAWCEIFLRTMPDTHWESWVSELTQRARQLELEVSPITSLRPMNTSSESPVVKEALAIVGQESPDSAGYATDGCRYSDLKNLIVLGPGSIEQAHRPDEWVSVDELQKGKIVYRRLLSALGMP